jgi:hypothetical protein
MSHTTPRGPETRRRPRRGAEWALVGILAAAVAWGEEPDVAARQAAERDAKALGWLLQQGREILVQEEPVDRQREQQIVQQAEQMQRFLQPVLASELEMIRQACGGLDATGRKRVLTAGRAAVTKAARSIAERQLTGRLGRDDFDPREEIRTGLVAELRTCAAAAELAAYDEEQAARAARRAAAAQLRIVAKLDQQLDLTSAQRRAIEVDLVGRWDAGWLIALTEPGGLINNHPPAPDYAAVAIEPHLAAGQAAAWEAWCRAAGARIVGRRVSWNFDGQGLQNIDDWWTR